MLEEGQAAPDFTAEDQDGTTVSLSDFEGRTVVLYFYPKDDTPGCTKEACSFRDNLQRLEERDVAVLGVSADTAESHSDFAEKYGLGFTLLADPDKDIIEAYGVEGRFGNAARVTFLVNGDGVIERVFEDVDPENHAEQVLEAL
ncbi:MAG: thioredoxin-dependent thiol peroxidase [Candidatus Nanohaloarchaea archaeon]|nr:thioredoxin-dependent thiol peroxidase [Candidatus Nanohaloarchaea archaeon]